MNPNILIIAALGGLLLINLLALVFLARDHWKLKRTHQALLKKCDEQKNDLAGLCAAAINVDRRLFTQQGRLEELAEGIEDYRAQENSSQPYRIAIQRVKKGASVQDLMDECGFARDEANLLVRLHGSLDKPLEDDDFDSRF